MSRIRKMMIGLAAAVLLTLGGAASPAPPVGAHSSGYCGHGTDGWWDLTTFMRSYTGQGYAHYHVYYHQMMVGDSHYQTKACPSH